MARLRETGFLKPGTPLDSSGSGLLELPFGDLGTSFILNDPA
jgi:hypothetical protein